jgi:23S rRNA pseudouridine1911/1915/1917 synthase
VTSRTITIAAAESGRTLGAVLKARLGLSWSKVRALVSARGVRINGRVCTDPVRRLRPHDRIDHGSESDRARPRSRAPVRPPNILAAPRGPVSLTVVYADDDVIVVDKPPGLTTMRHAAEAAKFGVRGRRFLPVTLADQLAALFPGDRIRAVHRIDRDTSGLVVFARTTAAERHLGKQFRAHAVSRLYRAIVRGRPADSRIESWLVRDRGDGRRGSGAPGGGQRAVTHVRLIEPLGSCSLIECELETGRTHQIRIHLGEAGAPLAGETVYDRPVHGAPAPDPSGAPRIALHAASLGFTHPSSNRRMQWESPLPSDLQAIVRRLRTVS